MRLGDKLRILREEKEAEQRKETERRRAAELLRQRQENAAVEAFFNKAFNEFQIAIELGALPEPVQLGNMLCEDAYRTLECRNWRLPVAATHFDPQQGFGVWSPEHPRHSAWQTFAERCQREGLVPAWRYQHDGSGLREWFELYVYVAD